MKKVSGAKVVTTLQALESPLPAEIQEALGELVGAAREGLLALSVGVGLGVVHELMELEVDEVVGTKGKHSRDRVAFRHGHENGSMTLGGRRVRGTVMFSDIRGFTSLVESQPPEETIELLNTYYTLMFDAISGHGGVVNQMIGDGLMAIFGAPLPLAEPSLAAVRAALDMVEMLELFNLERVALDKEPIRIGIGIASGEVVAGYTGTQQRATYTCIGDTVNLAARLEAHTKVAGRSILVDGDTQAALGDRVRLEPLGEVQFKGKAAAVPVFAVKAQAQ